MNRENDKNLWENIFQILIQIIQNTLSNKGDNGSYKYLCSRRDDLLGHLYWQPGVPTLCGIENDLPPVDAVAGLKWRILQICRDLYNLSNHGTLNQGKKNPLPILLFTYYSVAD